MWIRGGLGVWLLVGAVALSGCGSLKEGVVQSTVTRASPFNSPRHHPASKIADVANRNFRAKVARVDVFF